jgi:hypothetical protein
LGCSSASAAEKCPLIRPAGLADEQVRQFALQPFEQALQRTLGASDQGKTVLELFGKDDAPLSYGLSALAVGESLGFDALNEFADAAERLGKVPPAERLSLTELQELALKAYKRGSDAPPPKVRPNSAYKIMATSVSVPTPADGWYMLRCRMQDVTFVRPRHDGQTTATVRIAQMPPYTTDAVFLADVKAMMEASLPRGTQPQPWSPNVVSVNQSRCAEVGTVILSADRRVTYQGRICYGANGATLGHTVLFADNGPRDASSSSAEAKQFIDANKPE